MTYNIQQISEHFQIWGDFIAAEPYGTGHINDTFCVTVNQAGVPVRYIFQRINHHVFKDPAALMDNVRRVTEHQRHKVRRELRELPGNDDSRRCLTLVPTTDCQMAHVDSAGNTWRVYLFIEQAQTFDVIASPEQAYRAARAFGQFQRLLVDLPGERLLETIPGFHDTPKRFAAFEAVLHADLHHRAKECRAEIDFALKRQAIAGVLLDLHNVGEIPERVTHNDTKINNIMFDNASGEALCVIDLDTIMPGLSLYDFGDLVRTSVSPAAEDERDLSKVRLQQPMFESLARGFVEGTAGFLTPAEKGNLVFSGKLITFEIGLRFLTDFLNGDVYFKTHRDGQNLDRCRTQFRLVELIEQREPALNKFIETL